MHRLAIFIALFALSAAGCERTVIVRDRCGEPTAGQGLVPGERVLARYKDALYEGTVITVQQRLVTVAWDQQPPERSFLPRGWVRSMEDDAALRPRSWAACRADSGWQLCRVEAAPQGDISVTLASDGDSRTLAPAQVRPVPRGLEGWAAERGTEALRQARLKRLFAGARPVAAGTTVKSGQRVAAEWQPNSWWEATVLKVAPGTITVRWADGSADQTLAPDKVAPLTAGEPLDQGDLALCRWGSSGQLWPAVVDSAGQGPLQVTYSDGSKGRVPPEHCLAATSTVEREG